MMDYPTYPTLHPSSDTASLQPSLTDYWTSNPSNQHRAVNPARPTDRRKNEQSIIIQAYHLHRSLKRANSELSLQEFEHDARMSKTIRLEPIETTSPHQRHHPSIASSDPVEASLLRTSSHQSAFSILSISSSESVFRFDDDGVFWDDEFDLNAYLDLNRFALEFDPSFGIHQSWLEHLKPIFVEPEIISLHSSLSPCPSINHHHHHHHNYDYKSTNVQRPIQLQSEIYPPSKDLYSWSRLTPLDQVKVVILGLKPPCAPNQSHGLAFSQPTRCKRLSGAIDSIHLELANQFPDRFVRPEHGSLVSWARSGVLLLNMIQTTQRDHSTLHDQLGWIEFTNKVLEIADKFAGSSLNPSPPLPPSPSSTFDHLIDPIIDQKPPQLLASSMPSSSSDSCPSSSSSSCSSFIPSTPSTSSMVSNCSQDQREVQQALSSTSQPLKKGIVFIAWGKLAIQQIQSAGLFLPNQRNHKILTCIGSPYSNSAHEDGFFNNQHFKLANQFLSETYGSQHQIDWCNLQALDV